MSKQIYLRRELLWNLEILLTGIFSVAFIAGVTGKHCKVESLLKQMTLDEKLGQMAMVASVFLMGDNGWKHNATRVNYFVKKYKVGSLLNDPYFLKGRPSPASKEWATIINQVQSAYQETRLKIPVIYGLDSIHGANPIHDAVLFPHQLALAASFNRTLVKQVAHVAAKDTRAIGVHWNFSPVLDVGVNKQWSRLYETFGEDPFLVSEMGVEMIKAYQGFSLRNSNSVAVSLKHFIGYSASRSGASQDGVWMHERILNDYFRPPFQRAIYANASTIMTSYSDINGEHTATSKQYLVDLLRKEMGFEGVLASDFGQINRLCSPNHVASSLKEALYKSIHLGTIDFNMEGFGVDSIPFIKELVEEGAIPESTIDISVRRILTLKEKLGLLGSTGKTDITKLGNAKIGSPEDVEKAINAARESIILLQNNILPLKRSTKLLVTGPSADSLRHLSGGWSYTWLAAPDDSYFTGRGISILSGLRNLTRGSINHANVNTEEIISIAADYDAIVVCVGEDPYTEGQGDMSDMYLPETQLKLMDTLIEHSNKSVIVILSQGRPRVMNPTIRKAAAVLTSFLAGPYAGQAIAEIIFGMANPSAKLPITYANHPNANKLNYYRLVGETYSDVYWEFGHGLSYTTFQYSGLTLSSPKISFNSTITATVTVTNTGKLPGAEVVLFYISDIYRSVAPEVKKLRQFYKVHLNPKESAKVTFTITREDLAFHNIDNVRVIEAGEFTLTLGSTNLAANFTLASNTKRQVPYQPTQMLASFQPNRIA